MKNIKRILFVAIAVVLLGSTASAGGFRFGVKAGVALNSLSFDDTVLDQIGAKDNQAGFTGGLVCEFTVPIINLGLDASLMYVHRSPIETTEGKMNRDYIELPINVKYKIGIPVISNVLTPYLFTGPSFAFKTGKDEIGDFIKSKKCDVAWNVGLGVELVKHLQVSASYGFGITKALEFTGQKDSSAANIDGKNKYWTVTAAYLF